jgi:predicted MarR family transcription regulator
MYILNKLNLTKMAKATKNKNTVSVVQMTPGGRKLKKYSSIREAAASTGVSLP